MSNIGYRIRQARVAAGLSLRDLAERAAPLSATAISRYEQGEDVPRADTLQRLGSALRVPTSYFFQGVQVALDCPRYRRNSRFGTKAQAAVEAQIADRLERYLEVESLFPPARFEQPGLTQEDRKQIAELSEAELVAEWLRKAWQLGQHPVENLAEALEDRGIKVLLFEAPDGFDGLACWANGSIPIVVANGSKDWDRQRFDLAHELGELVLEPAQDVDPEYAAHRFAGAFLVPREVVRRELGERRATLGFSELRLLKMKYGISIQAWIRRAYDTGVISHATYGTLFRNLSAKGWRKKEPSEPREPDRARRYELLVHQAAAEGLVTPAREVELLGRIITPSQERSAEAELRLSARAAAARLEADELRAWLDVPGDDLPNEAR